MDKKLVALIGAVSATALGVLGATSSSAAPMPDPSQALRAESYADLLQPIPNAVALLQAADEQAAAGITEGAADNVQVAQYHHHHRYYHHHHRYYHHHHRYYHRYYHHHHHY